MPADPRCRAHPGSRVTVLAAAGLLMMSCHANSPLGPPTPGWKVQVVVPASQQQAQDTVLNYLKKTLGAMPPGVVFSRQRSPLSGTCWNPKVLANSGFGSAAPVELSALQLVGAT
jgi:hypothetical protein